MAKKKFQKILGQRPARARILTQKRDLKLRLRIDTSKRVGSGKGQEIQPQFRPPFKFAFITFFHSHTKPFIFRYSLK